MASQLTLADLMAKLKALTTGLDKTNEKVDKLMTDVSLSLLEKI